MSQISLEDMPYEVIKAHILDPDNSPLPERYRQRLDRAVSMSKLLDKNPIPKNAVKLHLSKFPEISKATAWKDFHLASRLYKNFQDFDFDFWMTWLVSDIVENILKSESTNTIADRQNIAREHANMARLLSKRPDEPFDPYRNEKHSFYIIVNLDNKKIKIEVDELHKLPINTIKELNRALFSGKEIDEQDAAEMMNS